MLGKSLVVSVGVALFLTLTSPSIPFISSSSSSSQVYAWDNGGRSKSLKNPAYGVHDWLAESSLNLLPKTDERGEPSSRYDWLRNNLSSFLIGTEAPDNATIAKKFFGRKRKELATPYGDPFRHHVYNPLEERIEDGLDDVGARRAEEEFRKAIDALIAGDERLAAFYAGAGIHYGEDCSNKGHTTPDEYARDHEAFESAVGRTITATSLRDVVRQSTTFQQFMPVTSPLEDLSGYDATMRIARRAFESKGTVVDGEQQLLPFDDETGNYVGCDGWSREYIEEVGGTLGYAVEQLSSVLHTITMRAEASRITTANISQERSTTASLSAVDSSGMLLLKHLPTNSDPDSTQEPRD